MNEITGEVTAVAAGSAIVAATAQDGGLTAFCIITVTEIEPPKPLYVTVSPAEITVKTGNTQQFTAIVTPEELLQDVTWEITGNESTATSININGLLSVANNETAKTIFVKATSMLDHSIYDMLKVTVELTTDVNDLFAQNLKLYPNPFHDVVQIEDQTVETLHKTYLRVINASGAVVHTQILNGNETIIRLHHLPAGMYFFHFEKDRQTKTLKAVKE